MDSVETVLTQVDHAWRGYGIPAADRARLAADLRLDLRQAATDGGDPAVLLGADIAGFARQLADEAGLRPIPRQHARILGAALLGAVRAGTLDLALVVGLYPLLVDWVDLPRSIHVPALAAALLCYGLLAAVALTGMIITVRWRLRDLPRIRTTVRMMSMLLPAASLVVTPITVVFAWTTGYSTAVPVVLAEVAIVLGVLAGAIVLARTLALHTSRRALVSDLATADPSTITKT